MSYCHFHTFALFFGFSQKYLYIMLLDNTGHAFYAAATQFVGVLIKYFIRFVVF